MEGLIQVRDLDLTYMKEEKPFSAIKELNLDISKGQFAVLVDLICRRSTQQHPPEPDIALLNLQKLIQSQQFLSFNSRKLICSGKQFKAN